MKINAKPFRISKNGVNTGIFKKIGSHQVNQLNQGGNVIRIDPQNNN